MGMPPPPAEGRDMKLRSTRTLLAIALTAVVGGAVALLTTGTAQAATATATFAKASDWGSGFEGRYTINGGSAGLTSWTVEFDLPAGTAVGSYWDALITSNGNHYTAKNREYNGTVGANATVTFGFVGSGGGSPSNCKLNGGACNGSGGGGGGGVDAQAPSVPTGLKVTGTTSSGVSLSWTASTDNVGVTGYEVRRNGASVGSPTATSFDDGGLAASTSYSYQVRARDAAGNWSGWSGSVSGTTTAGGGGGGGG